MKKVISFVKRNFISICSIAGAVLTFLITQTILLYLLMRISETESENYSI